MGTMADALAIHTTQAEMSSFFIDKMGKISVKSYGAIGDGVTDDTVDVQAAVTAAQAAGVSELWFPTGTYYVTALTGTTGLTFVGDNSTFTGGYTGTIVGFASHLVGFASHLADSMYLGAASAYGVNPSIGTADATSLLNAYFVALKAKGLKHAYFDKPHTYKVSGELTDARDLILWGNAEIQSSTIENYYISICKTMQTYNEKYNTMPYSATPFKQFGRAISEDRDIKVAIWGDSRFYSGTSPTWLDMSYNGASSGLTAHESGSDGLTYGDTLPSRLIDMLTTKFKDQTFDLYNYSIAGTTIQEWTDNKTFGATTQAWVDFYKDAAPDLLIIGFGMNEITFALSKEVKYYMKQIMDYIEANFSPIPTVVFATSPRPTLALDSDWGSFARQTAIDMAAYQIRVYGQYRGCYILDASKISNIKRCGFTYQNPIFKTVAITEATVDALAEGDYTKAGSTYTLQTINKYLRLPIGSKDFYLEFQVKFSNFPVGSENLQLGYNIPSDGSSTGYRNTILILPNVGSVASFRSYGNVMDVAHYTSITQQYSPGATWNDGAFRLIRIEKREDVLDVFVDNARVFRDRLQICNIPGSIRFLKDGGSTGLITMQNIKIYKGTYTQYLPSLTEYEMFGLYENGVYTLKPIIGGNGVNHNSTIGYEETDVPVLKEFVDDLAAQKQIDLTGSVVWNPAELVDGTGETSAAITVTGAAFGDTVQVGNPYDLQGITCNGYVDAADSVKIRLQNETTGTINLAEGTWTVRVIKAQ